MPAAKINWIWVPSTTYRTAAQKEKVSFRPAILYAVPKETLIKTVLVINVFHCQNSLSPCRFHDYVSGCVYIRKNHK